MCRADGMGKSGVLGSGIGQRSETKLPDASKALELGGREEAFKNLGLGSIERYQAVDRVPQDHGSSYHYRETARPSFGEMSGPLS